MQNKHFTSRILRPKLLYSQRKSAFALNKHRSLRIGRYFNVANNFCLDILAIQYNSQIPMIFQMRSAPKAALEFGCCIVLRKYLCKNCRRHQNSAVFSKTDVCSVQRQIFVENKQFEA